MVVDFRSVWKGSWLSCILSRKHLSVGCIGMLNLLGGCLFWHPTNSVKALKAILLIKQHRNRFCSLPSGCEQNLGSQKRKTENHARVIFHPCAQMPPLGWLLSFFACGGGIADIITQAKFYADWVRGFEVLIPPVFPISIGLAGHPYNSVCTTVLHCDYNP